MIAIMSNEIAVLLSDIPRRECAYGPGSVVFHLGDPVSQIHFVRAGMIHLLRRQQDGTSLILQRAGAGAILAEASMFSQAYHCEARATGEVRTWAISRETLRERISADGCFAQAWARRLAHEIQKTRLQAEIVSIRTVAARLDAWLDWHGAMPPKGEWASLAAEIGVSREALYRELARRRS